MFQNIISLAFNGISTVSDAVDMLENFDQLAKRPSIKDYVQGKAADMVYQMFERELKDVEVIEATRGKKNPPVPMPLSHPKYAGDALWTKALLMRIKTSKIVKPIYTPYAYYCLYYPSWISEL
jgi:hypothetical protein